MAEDDDEDERNLNALEAENNQLKTWRSKLIADDMGTVYIERFRGSPVSIEVSIFKQTR